MGLSLSRLHIQAVQHVSATEVEGQDRNPYGIFGGIARLARVGHFCPILSVLAFITAMKHDVCLSAGFLTQASQLQAQLFSSAHASNICVVCVTSDVGLPLNHRDSSVKPCRQLLLCQKRQMCLGQAACIPTQL